MLLQRILKDVNFQTVAFYRKVYNPSLKGYVVEVEVEPEVDPPTGAERFIYNRNPRNLERLGIAYRNEGWSLEKPGRTFYHKLVIASGYKEIKVSCLHNSGRIAVSASTDEWAIRKFLYKPGDKSACINLGRIFAQRCLQSGLNEMINTYDNQEGKLSLLLQEIQNGGITFCEPDRLELRNTITKVQAPRPWNVTVED